MKAISPLEMSAIDRNAMYLGIDPLVLMENAGRSVAEEVLKNPSVRSALILCGPGNNGGDGLVAARHLSNRGVRVSVLLLGEPRTAIAKRNLEILSSMHSVEIRRVRDSSDLRSPEVAKWAGQHDCLVDAMLGTGARGTPREPVASALGLATELDAYRVAVDIPSGVDAETGERWEDAFRADVTVTFHCAKNGHLKADVGRLVVADIGIPAEAEETAGPGDLLLVSDRRDPLSHKGQNGVLLVIGGSREYTGAPAICAMAALRTGIDLVYVAVPEAVRGTVAAYSPSLITRPIPGDRLTQSSLAPILSLTSKADAVAIGPGLGREAETMDAVRNLVGHLAGKPVVVDADGLSALAGRADELGKNVVLTPHAGEFQALTGSELPTEHGDRKRVVMRVAAATRCTWAVKGPWDIIASGEKSKINKTGNACMTVGGSGDCLTGIIGALLARGNDPFRSAVAGCFVSGRAGDLASEEIGCHITPTDILERIPLVFAEASK